MKKILLSCMLCHCVLAGVAQTTQPVVIAVVGSSTAAGTGPADPQKAFVNRYRTYLKSINASSEVFNIAVGGSNTYHCNPVWYNAGASRPAPDFVRSISRAVNPDNGYRKPDAIIISLPTNDAASAFTLAETQANFERMVATADSLHIPVWVTTSQPRNDLPQSQINLLLGLRDWVLSRFAAKSLNFWTEIAGPDNLIKPSLRTVFGDLIHLNDSAHGILFDRVVNARILDTIGKGPVRYGYLVATRQAQAALVQWESHRERYMQQYIVERSTDSLNWTAVGSVNANGSTIVPHQYSFSDAAAPAGVVYYRLCMEDIYARRFYTEGKKTGSSMPPQPPAGNPAVVVAVIGSSTAANQGPADPQKSFANRYRTYLKSLNSASEVYNIAIPWGGSTTYHCNPSWYVPGPYRPAPNTDANITRALNPAAGYRKPDAIIVSLPSNDAASSIPFAETQANFERIFAAADSLHVPVWVTSSQPRNDLSQAQINTLLTQQAWIMQRFGVKAVDFWTDIAGADNLIKPSLRTIFNNGTGLNDSAHGILYQKILDEHILDTIARGPVRLAAFGVTAQGGGARIQWESHRERYMQQYTVERSADSLNWQPVGTVAANGSTITPHAYSSTDATSLAAPVYYRLCMEDIYARKFYTYGIKFTPGTVMPDPDPAPATSEAVVIAVVGSSTAAGTGPTDPQKAFVNRLRTYLKAANNASEVFNIAVGGSNTYHCNPVWYNAGASRPAPDFMRSISRAVNPDNGFRKPDAIIISLPSNDAASAYTLAETQANFERMVATTDSLHVPVWVTTSQPRNDLPQSQINLLLGLRDWVMQRFGAKALDFWTDIAGPDNLINPIFRTGDLIHLNDSAHGVLYRRVLAGHILDTFARGPVRLASFAVSQQGQGARIQWESHRERYMQRYIVERSTDSLAWAAMSNVNASGSTIVPRQYASDDASVLTSPVYYRLCMEDIYGRKFYTHGIRLVPVPVNPDPGPMNQPVVVAVIGSSTAANQGPADPQKSFANRYRTYLKSLNSASEVYNIAIPWGGSTTYHCNPSWYVPGPYRPAPNTDANITRALNPAAGYRKPDAIIVSLPSNDAASSIPFAETQANFERIFAAADSLHVPVWVTSSQPRNDLSQAQINTLLTQQTWIMQRFGVKAVDFWTDIAGADNLIKPSLRTIFNNGTGLNDSAHGILYQKILDEHILDTIARGPVRLAAFGVTAQGGGARIQWESHRERYMQQYIVERSADSLNWQPVGTVAANGSTITPHAYSSTDATSLAAPVYYRLCMEDIYARKFYTYGIKFTPAGLLRLAPPAPATVKAANTDTRVLVYPNPAGSSFKVRGLAPGRHTLQVFNALGQLVYEDRGYENEKEVVQGWRNGVYYVVIDGGKQKISLLRLQ